jgi:hypothetical protein
VQAPLWVAMMVMALGLALVLRATFMVTVGGEGRFRFDPWLTSLLGFALMLTGQYLFPR